MLDLRGRQQCLPHDVRWILFDAVGTLIYADPPVAEAYRAAGEPFGSRLSVADIGSRFRQALAAEQAVLVPTSEANERLRWRRIVGRVIDDAPHATDSIFERLWQHFAEPDHWRLYDDAPAALEALRVLGFRLGIASNFDDRLMDIVRGHPSLAACQAVFVSSGIGFTKPDLRFFRAIEGRLGALPSEIALVGDDEVADVEGADAAGWRAILLDRDDQCHQSGAICSLAELL